MGSGIKHLCLLICCTPGNVFYTGFFIEHFRLSTGRNPPSFSQGLMYSTGNRRGLWTTTEKVNCSWIRNHLVCCRLCKLFIIAVKRREDLSPVWNHPLSVSRAHFAPPSISFPHPSHYSYPLGCDFWLCALERDVSPWVRLGGSGDSARDTHSVDEVRCGKL